MSFRRSQLLPTFCRSHSHSSWATIRRSVIVLCPCGAQQRHGLGELFQCKGCGSQNRAPTSFGLLQLKEQQLPKLKRDRRNGGRVAEFGTITKLAYKKGFGFIKPPDGPDVYFSCWSMLEDEFNQLIEGQEVGFSLDTGGRQNGKKPRARHVEPLRAPAVESVQRLTPISGKANTLKPRKKTRKVHPTTPEKPNQGLPRRATSEQVVKMKLLGVRGCDARRCTVDEANETITTLEKAKMTDAKRAKSTAIPTHIQGGSANGCYKVPNELLEVRHAYLDEDKKGWSLTTKRGIRIAGPFASKADAEVFWRTFQEKRGRKAEALSNGSPKRQGVAIVSRSPKRSRRRENTHSRSVWTLRPIGGRKPGSHASGRHC
jgi:cold shock CspA family protein